MNSSEHMSLPRAEISPGITVHPHVRFGKAVIRGRRVEVATILNDLAHGESIESEMESFQITRQNVLDALTYAHKAVLKDSARIQRRLRRRIVLTPAPYQGIDDNL